MFDCGSEECLAMDPNQVEELMEIQNDHGMKPTHAVINEMMWLDSQVSAKTSKFSCRGPAGTSPISNHIPDRVCLQFSDGHLQRNEDVWTILVVGIFV